MLPNDCDDAAVLPAGAVRGCKRVPRVRGGAFAGGGWKRAPILLDKLTNCCSVAG